MPRRTHRATGTLAVLACLCLVPACSSKVSEYDSSGDQADEAGSDTSADEDSGDSGSTETGESDSSTEETGDTSDSSSDGGTDTTSDTGSEDTTDTGGCPPGDLGCPCDAGQCKGDYECEGEVCVDPYPWGNCGWNPDEGYYYCGFMGEDPDGVYPIDCGDLPLIDDAPCPDGFGYEGCCDQMGSTWYCLDGFVVRDVCG